MKRVIVLIVISLFLISFISAGGMTASAVDNEEKDKDINSSHNREITSATNQLRERYQNQSECPNDCTCEGSVTRCKLQNGTREMTIRAGSSGNIIVQTKGINASTRVQLYRSDDKLYGLFRNNQTKEIRVLPDEVRERIRERIQTRLENQDIELDEDGIYQIQAEKRTRLFGFISVRARVRAEVNSETGEVIRIRSPWWNFIAKDEIE